jgi:hypothetical protein
LFLFITMTHAGIPLEVLARFQTYAEISPSQTGVGAAASASCRDAFGFCFRMDSRWAAKHHGGQMFTYFGPDIRTSSLSGRRTFAMRRNAKGVKLMGHRHIGTNALYCELSDDVLRKDELV